MKTAPKNKYELMKSIPKAQTMTYFSFHAIRENKIQIYITIINA